MSDILLTEGYRRNLLMVSALEKRNYTAEIILDDNISALVIKEALESICDIKVKKVHETTEWTIKDIDTTTRGVNISYDVKIAGKECRFTKLYLPRVKSTINKLEAEVVLKGIFGNTFKIIDWQERS